MRFDILTLFPDVIQNYCSKSILKRAQDAEIICVNTINPRDYTLDKHKKVDDTPYGGGAGMVLMAQPYVDAYNSVEKLEKSKTIMLSPQGQTFTKEKAEQLTEYDQLILLCGHYEGFDERIRDIIKPEEISIGDFVLTGGELPALCIVDSVSRKLKGTVGNFDSIDNDSFENGLLEYPQYTKPREYHGLCVPDVLLDGNHKLINEFRFNEQLKRTKERRPDLYERYLKNNK